MDIMRAQGNMTWIDMPHHHVTLFKKKSTFYKHFIYLLFMDCKFFISCHDKNTCHDLIIIILYFGIFKQNILKVFINTIIQVSYIIFIHDTSTYIHIMYTNTHIHEGLNPKLHGNAPRSSPPNHFKSLMNCKKSLILLSST
jgi:hypothetical protein